VFGTESQLQSVSGSELVGYAIVKCDAVPSQNVNQWHIFESVFKKYQHPHNYVHGAKSFALRAGTREFSVVGVLYCQQNSLNKACAHVALRSLCALHLPDTDLPYQKINELASVATGRFDPKNGLKATQIQAVLASLRLQFSDVDYETLTEEERGDLPYQKFLYAGVESGAGALLGFKFTGPDAQGAHIIPFFGHTFNQDTWVPNADVAYFHVGENFRYIPSESWMSSLIGHDDNFGSNFCVPRFYATSQQVQYVVALHPTGIQYSGVIAEAIAVDYLYALLPDLSARGVKWLDRLAKYTARQEVILRALALTKVQYREHLKEMQDWNSRRENPVLCAALSDYLPERVWMIEVSVPELFPANKRKLGEIVLDATRSAGTEADFSTFVLARFPGRYLLLRAVENHHPEFANVTSLLQSHTPLYSKERGSF
jgi:hypothetical protein